MNVPEPIVIRRATAADVPLIVAERDATVVATLQVSYLPGLSRRGASRARIEGVRVAASK